MKLMNLIRKPSTEQRERGQSMVELALVLTLVLFVLAGAVDFGRAYFAIIALRDAAQEGVVYASLNPTDVSGITSRVHTSSSSPIDMTTTTVVTSWSDADHKCAGFVKVGGNYESYAVTVDVQYPFHFSMPMIQVLFPSNTITLSIDATHTILAPPCQ